MVAHYINFVAQFISECDSEEIIKTVISATKVITERLTRLRHNALYKCVIYSQYTAWLIVQATP